MPQPSITVAEPGPGGTIPSGPDFARGRHNTNEGEALSRLIKGASYRDCSTVAVFPTKEFFIPRVVNSWWALQPAMNQPMVRLVLENMEVADAYNRAIDLTMRDPALSKFKFLLTVEWDNIPPPDGHLKLLGHMHNSEFAAIGGLYWTKGEGGQPMIYGEPDKPGDMKPLKPTGDPLQECNGIAMGFTLWDLEIFRDKRLIKRISDAGYPVWFETVENGTQDLEFCGRARKHGYRFAVDCSLKVGHYDHASGVTW